jgi:hypothetical protein
MIDLEQNKNRFLYLLLGAIILLGSLSLYFANAVPEGATVTGTPLVDAGPNKTPGSRTDPGGRIITLTLTLAQQDFAWKAYVGNVTGSYVLKNANNYSIYEWPLGAAILGEVYLSRNNSLNFTNGAVVCANLTHMQTEQSFFGMTATATDNINNTFNGTNHTTFNVGTNTIAQNTCKAIALWVNNTAQAQSNTSMFQEIALYDGANLFYASLINNNQIGFENTTMYDFQAIVAENRSSSTGTPYYFYVELGS